VPQSVKEIYSDRVLEFGPEYIIPTPFDPRLIEILPVHVAKAAEASGVARMPIKDYEKYKLQLKARKEKIKHL